MISHSKSLRLHVVKHRIDGLDKDNFVYSYTLVEGDALSDKVEKISYEIKLVASADGGSIIKSAIANSSNDFALHQIEMLAATEQAFWNCCWSGEVGPITGSLLSCKQSQGSKPVMCIKSLVRQKTARVQEADHPRLVLILGRLRGLESMVR
ncbi:hypothetical protein PRUPE_1G090800 [Prunus persica]|uniref:Uncharacterized protein n=1 Tax=Prunus persica TaxID=3760 RepID=M5XJK5_PRUPE|nr:hypothetical protein PRUPE_1G090800 [Prunus persica]